MKTQLLIDYATGDNWEVPADLYLQYEWFQQALAETHKKEILQRSTIIQYWVGTLTEEDRGRIVRIR